MKKLHLICNAHIDPIWQWTWDEGISSALATFKSAADLAEEFDYVFCHNESLLYEAVEQYAPELFERIKKLVKAGKWKIMGGWYLQPDCLMASGETYVRLIAEGKKYFAEKFGEECIPTVAVNFDSFGHSVGLAQILAKNGYKGYMHCRPNPSQFVYPSKFYRWVGPDGSSVIGTETFSYSSALGHAVEKIKSAAYGEEVGMLGSEAKDGEKVERIDDVNYVLWGVGNHGGGPSRKDLREIRDLKIDGVEIAHSTPEALFADGINVGGEIRESLVTCMPGCYTSTAKVKQAFKRTESLYYATERMLAKARLMGFEGDFEDFKGAEKKLLLSSFHDILPGTSIEDAEGEALELLNSCAKATRDCKTAAFLYMVMGQKPAGEGEYPIFVFNYETEETVAPVEAEFMLADQNWSDEFQKVHIYDENGVELPCQQIKERSTLNGLDWRKRIVFEGKLAPLSVTRFTVKTSPVPYDPIAACHKKGVAAELDGFLEGTLLSAPLVLETLDDNADPWGMSEKEYKEGMGENPVPFRSMTAKEAQAFCATSEEFAPVHLTEDGEVLQTVEACYTNGKTNAVVAYKKYRNQPYTDVKVTLEFTDKNKLIRLKVPVPADMQGKGVGDGPYVWEEKKAPEVNYQKWLGMQKGEDIFAVVNDGTYGGRVENGYLYLTLIRGTGYCFHPLPDRSLYPEDRYLPRVDCGRYTYNFRIFKGGVYEVTALAEAFQRPPYAVNVFPIGGGKESVSEVKIEGDVVSSIVKVGVDGGFVARVFNPATEKKEFSVRIGDVSTQATAGAYEVVSVTVKDGKATVSHDEMPV